MTATQMQFVPTVWGKAGLRAHRQSLSKSGGPGALNKQTQLLPKCFRDMTLHNKPFQ